MEDYKQKYEEALERAKKYYNRELYAECNGSLVEDIFPELKESEDERIRKEIIAYLDAQEIITEGKDKDFRKWIAWLKKQGEHANFRNKIQIGDEVTRNEDGVLINLSQFDRLVKKKKVKQDEQKSIDIFPIFRVGDYIRNKKTSDKVLIEQLDVKSKAYWYQSYDGSAEVHSDIPFSKQDEWELIGQKIVEQKPTWSEEDEIGLGNAMWAIEQARTIAKDENDMGNLWHAGWWLNSLKERMKGE